jgi:hypothetical protein
VRQGHQDRPDPAAASGRPGHRPGDRIPHARAYPAQQPRRPDGPARGHPPPCTSSPGAPASGSPGRTPYAPPHRGHDHARRRRRPPGCPDRRPSREPAPPCGRTGPARTWTATPTTSWPPTWPPAPDPDDASRGSCRERYPAVPMRKRRPGA